MRELGMREIPIEIAGFYICIMTETQYYSTILHKLNNFLITHRDVYDMLLYIYDEGEICVEQRFKKYTSEMHDERNVIYSYAKGGMFGWFEHKSNTGYYYISSVNGPVKRNPLLPLFCGISVLLPQKGALLFHCSAVVDGQGYTHLFTGESGAGKTTIARMLKKEYGFKVISDDTVILKINAENMIEAYSTPFWDVMKSTQDVGIVKTINAIRQNECTSVVECSQRQLRECLLRNAFFRAPKRKYSEHIDALLKTAHSLCKLSRYNIIEFEKNTKFWRMMCSE